MQASQNSPSHLVGGMAALDIAADDTSVNWVEYVA
jgi:hypothetical protein